MTSISDARPLSSTGSLPTGSSPGPSTNSRGRVFAWGLFLIVLASIAFEMITLTGGYVTRVPMQRPDAVFRWEGTGTRENSEPFTVDDNWELRWTHQGKLEEIRWTNEEGKMKSFMAMHRKPIRKDAGVNNDHGGTFRLSVFGEGPWKVEVYQFPK